MYSIDINAGKQKICEIPLLTTKKLKHSPSVQIKNSREAYTLENLSLLLTLKMYLVNGLAVT